MIFSHQVSSSLRHVEESQMPASLLKIYVADIKGGSRQVFELEVPRSADHKKQEDM